MGMSALNIRKPDSPITIYVQHPIPIPGHGEKTKITLKPLMLTKKVCDHFSLLFAMNTHMFPQEQKKMRKQRRQAELQDKRDKIKMGLIPPDPPKGNPILQWHFYRSNAILLVRLSNLMKVLTSDAVQDPTKVEARVRREVAIRKHQHEKMNAERKLTDEQRREKIENKKLEDERKGLYAALFKYVHLFLFRVSTNYSVESKFFQILLTHSKCAKTLNKLALLVSASTTPPLMSSTLKADPSRSNNTRSSFYVGLNGLKLRAVWAVTGMMTILSLKETKKAEHLKHPQVKAKERKLLRRQGLYLWRIIAVT